MSGTHVFFCSCTSVVAVQNAERLKESSGHACVLCGHCWRGISHVPSSRQFALVCARHTYATAVLSHTPAHDDNDNVIRRMLTIPCSAPSCRSAHSRRPPPPPPSRPASSRTSSQCPPTPLSYVSACSLRCAGRWAAHPIGTCTEWLQL